MSVSTVDIIMRRIASATEESPIAVFHAPEKGKLNAVFGATSATQEQIKTDDGFIGMFHRGMNAKNVRSDLIAAA